MTAIRCTDCRAHAHRGMPSLNHAHKMACASVRRKTIAEFEQACADERNERDAA